MCPVAAEIAGARMAGRPRQFVLVFAPFGRDAEVAGALLRDAGFNVETCADLPSVEARLGDDAAFVLVTEEALTVGSLRRMAEWVAGQPSWSDLPFIVLTRRDQRIQRDPLATKLAETLGNISFLERPFHPTTFLSLARTAWKGRQRQYEARQLILDAKQSADRLRQMNETLEERVMQRTAELERAHEKVLAEMRHREAVEEQLRQTQKVEMMGQLTGGVAHDFNNLLSAVIGNLDLLRRHVPEDPRLLRYIEGALQGAQRGAALTQRLLAFARRQSLKIEPVDLVDMVAGMKDLILRSIGDQIELRLDLPERLPRALADANQLELALLNLIVNARDAMPEGGAVTIRLDSPRRTNGTGLPEGRYVRLSVTDSGTGMDEETLGKATEPFFSTKELGKGTGLGLSMIHGLAHQLHGRLSLSSRPGRGTTAELWLPVTREALRPAGAGEKGQAAEATRPATILVVDDDALIAMSTVDMLEDLGHAVIEAHSGSEALDVLADGTEVDLMITDFSMPRMTGLQLAESARKLRPGMPVLLATGFADLPEGAEISLPRLSKPYQQTQLAAEIGKLLK
jgi:signal transduction histidine kinase